MNGRDKQRTVGSLYHEHTLMRSEEIATVETDLFEHREVKPDLRAMETLCARIRKELESKDGIKIV